MLAPMHSPPSMSERSALVLPRKASTLQRDRYTQELIERGSSIELPELRGDSLPEALYHLHDRGGVDVAAVQESALDEHQLDALSRFRFAQYLAAGLIDADVAFAQRLDHDDAVADTTDAVHFVASAAGSGQLLASVCLFAPPRAEPGT